jgi:hypothetical protein
MCIHTHIHLNVIQENFLRRTIISAAICFRVYYSGQHYDKPLLQARFLRSVGTVSYIVSKSFLLLFAFEFSIHSCQHCGKSLHQHALTVAFKACASLYVTCLSACHVPLCTGCVSVMLHVVVAIHTHTYTHTCMHTYMQS